MKSSKIRKMFKEQSTLFINFIIKTLQIIFKNPHTKINETQSLYISLNTEQSFELKWWEAHPDICTSTVEYIFKNLSTTKSERSMTGQH